LRATVPYAAKPYNKPFSGFAGVDKQRLHYMNENDTLILRDLKNSYRQQLFYYRALGEVVRKIMSRLELSRGDFGTIKGDLTEKQRLLTCIEQERTRTAPQVNRWQEHKQRMVLTDDAREFDAILQETETVIRDFLDGEDQLRKYIESLLRKTAA
jgi:hypothetical protein